MVDFAGWYMPVWFSSINEEHQCVRERMGLFDVSHMGQVHVTGPDACKMADQLVTNNVKNLEPGCALYSPMCKEDGGIVDDLIIYKRSNEDLLLVINASTTPKDYAHMLKHAKGDVKFENVSDQYSQIAVQGPKALTALAKVWPDIAEKLEPFHFIEFDHEGNTVMVAGTGYTGENGFELYIPWATGPKYWKLFMEAGAEFDARPIGLGARDTLRLEAKLCLYGNDIDESTNPLEAGLKWTVDMSTDFVGKEALERIESEGLSRKLVGFRLLDKGIPRQHQEIFLGDKKIGEVTSGTASPTLGKIIGLAYIDVPHTKRGTEVEIQIRKRRVAAKLIKTPFYKASK